MFRGDVFGGVTAAVVGLPVALAFGVASGLGAVAGLYGAIALGFFAAMFGGTKSQISGPTGPMAVAMAVIVTTHADSLTEVFTIVILTGLIQVLLGVLRIGRLAAYTPYSVYMDDSAAMVVEQLIEIALDEDTACIVMGLSGPAAGTLEALNVLGRVPADRFVATRDEARETARRILEA